MKKNIFILLFALAFLSSKAQTMYIKPKIGTQSSYQVTNIKKLTFSDGNLLVTNTTGSNSTFVLSENRYINFTDLTLGTISNQVVINSFYVYPNPTFSVLNVANDDSSQIISHLEIISLEGRVLIEQNSSQVEVASLPIGMYFCKIISNNKTQTIKFLKE